MSWYKDSTGNISALRIIVVPAAVAGIITVLAGVVAMFYDKSAAGTAMTTGAGILATAEGAKAWQKQNEKRDNKDG